MNKDRQQLLSSSSREAIERLANEMTASTDRASAVLGQAMLEELIKTVIAEALRGDDKHKIQLVGDEERPGVLGFADQCRLAHGLDLLDADALSDLLLIAKIRNRFGHSTEGLTFETQSIKDRCKELKTLVDECRGFYHKETSESRQQYTCCVIALFLHVLHRSTREQHKRTLETKYRTVIIEELNEILNKDLEAKREATPSAHYQRPHSLKPQPKSRRRKKAAAQRRGRQ